MLVERTSLNRPKFGAMLHSEPTLMIYNNNRPEDEDFSRHFQSNSSSPSPPYYAQGTPTSSNNASPYVMSPWNPSAASPYNKSPWIMPSLMESFTQNGLIGSLVREEGHIYSLAVSGDLLYTGSDSKNIRVWKNLNEYTGFKSTSGFVKAIVISGGKIFTGHQDGKIRIWNVSKKKPRSHKRIGTLPTLKDYVKSGINPNNYVQVRRNKNALKIKHFDAVSSLSLDEENDFLYSGSWDKTLKVWRILDSNCLESIVAHDDALNSVVARFGCFVFTGSADGTVKMWKRQFNGKGKIKLVLDRVLLKQESAVTALAVNRSNTVLYGGSSDGLVNFWQRDQKNNLSRGGVLRGHKLAVLCLAAADNLLFSGSADKNICVWKRDESGAHICLSVLTGHTGPVKSIAVEESDEADDQNHDPYFGKGNQRWIVYTGSLDKSVKVWRVSERVQELSMFQEMASNGYDPSTRFDSSPIRQMITIQNRSHFQS